MRAKTIAGVGLAAVMFNVLAGFGGDARAQTLSRDFKGFDPQYVRVFGEGMARGCRETHDHFQERKPRNVAELKATLDVLINKYHVFRSRLPKTDKELGASHAGQANGTVQYAFEYFLHYKRGMTPEQLQGQAFQACVKSIVAMKKLARPGGAYPTTHDLPDIPRPKEWGPKG